MSKKAITAGFVAILAATSELLNKEAKKSEGVNEFVSRLENDLKNGTVADALSNIEKNATELGLSDAEIVASIIVADHEVTAETMFAGMFAGVGEGPREGDDD